MFTPEFIAMIIAYGATVIGIVELVKKALKLNGWINYVVSLIVAPVVCLPSIGQMPIEHWIIMAVCVFLEANGLFKAFHTKSG